MERLPTGIEAPPDTARDAAPDSTPRPCGAESPPRSAATGRRRDPADAARLLLVLLAAALAAATVPHVRGKPPPVAVLPVRIDLDHAPAGLLRALPGVGRVLAARIVATRAERPFASVEDLLRVPGVGPSLVARIAPHALAGDASATPHSVPARIGAAPVGASPVEASGPDGAARR